MSPIIQLIVVVVSLVATNGIFVFVLKLFYIKINRKVDEDLCKQKHEMIEFALKKGEEKFKTIVFELNKINALLIRLDERLALWTEKNKQQGQR